MKMISEKRRYATVEINGVRFTLDKKNPIPRAHIIYGYTDIYDAYKRPSRTKIAIWKDWVNWFYQNNGYCSITSKNCNFFTVQGFVRDSETNKLYFASITYANQYLYEVEG